MKSVSIPALMMASICVYISLYYFWLYFKKNIGLVNLTFALTCFTTAFYDFFSAGLYNSSSITEGLIWQRLQFSSLALISLSITWFVYFFTLYKSKKIFILSSTVFIILFLLGIFIQSDLTLSINNPKIKNITMGSLINITYYEADPGIIYIIQYAFMVLLSLGIIIVIVQNNIYYRDNTEKQSKLIIFSLLAFFFTALNDIFVGAGIYSFIYLFEYTSLLIIASIAYLLQNEFIEENNEVIELNKMLKEKIDDTTIELFFCNIGKELYKETLNILSGNSIDKGPAMMNRMISYDNNTSIQKISRDMSIVSNMDELLKTAIKKAVAISGAEEGYFFLTDKNSKPLLKTFYNISDSYPEEVDETVFQKIIQEEKFLITLSGDHPQKSTLSVPVKLEDELLGIVYLKKNLTGDPFTEQDGEIMSVFLTQSARALENAFLYQKMKNLNQEKVRQKISATSEEKIKKAIQFIEDNYMYNISRENLAASIDMHPDSLSRYFKIFTGKKLGDYINEFRVNRATEKLLETDDNIIDIAYSVGFESLTSFNRAFLKFKKTTPKKFRMG